MPTSKVSVDGVSYTTDNEQKLREWIAAGKPGQENLILPEHVCFGTQATCSPPYPQAGGELARKVKELEERHVYVRFHPHASGNTVVIDDQLNAAQLKEIADLLEKL